MYVDKALREQPRASRFGLLSRNENHLAVGKRRLRADSAQVVEVELDLVPAPASHQGIEMGEAFRPESPAARHHRRDAVARAERARDPRAAPLLRTMDEQVVAPRAQPAEQFPFP